jgi:fatty acid desaturase
MGMASVELTGQTPLSTGGKAPAPLITGNKTLGQVTADICAPLERRAGIYWWLAFLPAFAMLLLGVAAVAYLWVTGVGVWA